MPDLGNRTFFDNISSATVLNFWRQLVSISYATQAVFLGNAFLQSDVILSDYRQASQPSFLEIKVGSNSGGVSEFVWGDVLRGIEEMSHNVTAALLTLNSGTMSANCSFDHQAVVYQYSSFALWAPYGVSNCPLLSCYVLTISLATFYRRPWVLL